MDNFNIDENSINKIKKMMDNGDLSNVMSQLPPELIQNISSMISSNNSNYNNNNNSNNKSSNNKTNNNFDFNNIDMNTILKMKKMLDKLNNSNDPRKNLLSSLKPYLRNNRKEKLDQYSNLLNIAQIAEILKNDDKKENNNNV